MTDELAPLTSGELDQLAQCEAVVQRGLQAFYEIGAALQVIRDNRLYRQHYRTFDDYCEERWDIQRGYGHRLIKAAEVHSNLLGLPDTPLPSNEAQARELAPLPPDEQRDVWQQVIESGERPTAALVKRVKQSRRRATPTVIDQEPEPIEDENCVQLDTKIEPEPPTVLDHYTLPETPPLFLQPPTTQPRQRIERALDEDTIDRLDACGVAYINSMSEDDGRTWAHQVIDADANPRIFTAMGLMVWLEDLERGMVLLPAQDLLLVEDDTAVQPVEQPAAQATGPAALQMQIAALEGERDQYKEQAEKHFKETERLWSEIAKIDTELRDMRRERDAARADLEAERQRADGLEHEADTLSDERNEALDERDALRQQLAQVRATQPAWVPETPDEALDTDGLLVELVKALGTEPTSLLALVKRLTTTREMLSHSLARCAHLWERLGLVLGDATPGTGGRGLWVPLDGAAGYTFGTIKREARADLHVPMADSSDNGAGHGGRPPDTSLRDRVRSLLTEHPNWTQQQIADAAGCGISLVKAVRAGRK